MGISLDLEYPDGVMAKIVSPRFNSSAMNSLDGIGQTLLY